MKKRNLRRIVYPCLVLALFVLGIFVWIQTSRATEEKVFMVNGQQEARFEYYTRVEYPRIVKIRLDGRLECDGMLVVKEEEGENSIRFRRSFPVKSGELKGREAWQTIWTNRGMILEFKTKGCVANDVRIIVEVEG